MREILEDVIADIRGDAAVLGRNGHKLDAEIMVKIADRIARAAEDYTTWLSERDAILWTGRPLAWLRVRYGTWARDGHARLNPHHLRERLYRRCVLPRRANLDSIRADAERAAKGEVAA